MKKNIINLMLAGLTLLSSCQLSGGERTSHYVKLVKTAPVVETTSSSQKQFPAVVEESEEVNLAFRVAGPIEEILVNEGDYVKKGQLIAIMDPRDYKVQQKAAETQVKQLRSEYARIAELRKRNGVSANDYEKMKAGKEIAEQQLNNASDQLKDTKLYAPFSGYINRVNFVEGELVNQGTMIASIIDISLLKVEISVPASFYIYRDSITSFECVQEDIADEVFPLELYGNNVKANNNGLYTLYLYHTPQDGCHLAPGMNVKVSVDFSLEDKTKLSIPVNAIVQSDAGDFVWLVGDDLTVTKRLVDAGSDIDDGQISIISGLQGDERVVIGGLNLLHEGEKVRLVPAKSPTNIGDLL